MTDTDAAAGATATHAQVQEVLDWFDRYDALVGAGDLEGMADLARVAAPPLHAGRWAIVGARLVDGTDAPPVDDAVVVIDDGKIVSAGKAEIQDVPRPALLEDRVLVKVNAVALNPTDWSVAEVSIE